MPLPLQGRCEVGGIQRCWNSPGCFGPAIIKGHVLVGRIIWLYRTQCGRALSGNRCIGLRKKIGPPIFEPGSGKGCLISSSRKAYGSAVLPVLPVCKTPSVRTGIIFNPGEGCHYRLATPRCGEYPRQRVWQDASCTQQLVDRYQGPK